jgi:acetyl-CoA carboxylase carboxyl transferase alpha subunit/acetyl-CoA carboxylase carboxyl transferase beta subunit
MTAISTVTAQRHGERDQQRAAAPWLRCPGCRATTYRPRVARNQMVCPECGHHQRISVGERLRRLLDEGSFLAAPPVRSADPLEFTDSVRYPERLARAERATGLAEAAVYGWCTIGGQPVVVAALDFAFLGGSMGSAVGEAVTRAAEESLRSRCPLLLITASGGARMQEGALSLMQMAKTAQAIRRLQDAGVPTVCLLTDPTFGGVTASFATLADILIAERGSLIGFAGPRVIATATREQLPPGFQTAEDLLARGLVDLVEPRTGLRPLLIRLLRLLGGAAGMAEGRPLKAPAEHADAPITPTISADAAVDAGQDASSTLKTARDIRRPTALDHIAAMCDDFVELHGDRLAADDGAIVGGLADLGGRTVLLLGHQKGHNTAELVARNFGMPQPEGYRKARRLMALAGRLGVPVVALVDTQGAAPGVGAEQRGQAWAIAECIAGLASLPVPVVSVITGEGGSGGALALAVANRVLMLRHACYSVISPESCSTILFGDPSHAPAMAAALRLTAPELVRLGVADGIVAEPEGGAQQAPEEASALLRAAILGALDDLAACSPDELLSQRHERFRRQGTIADG